jgi:acetolactate synthase II small subunit
MNAHTDEASQQVEITVHLHSTGRSVDTLARQIGKLYDVRSVACVASAEQAVVMRGSVAC